MAIQSFADAATQVLFETGKVVKGAAWGHIKKIACRKLDMLDYAVELKDLRSPPGNRLEKLSGKLVEFYSIRINDQWRIIFKWSAHGPENVAILDYH
ncbi:MAG: type II toxin-antitoxin system RelE/ParE family toxin [Bdellovibrionota bacterium]